MEDARYVLLGEASHGTADYYQVRDVLTRRLIEEKGFSFVAVEGDWPDCQAVHCSVVAAPGAPEDPGQVETALEAYRCFEPYVEDPQTYALSTRYVPEGCAPQVVGLLMESRQRAARAAAQDGSLAEFAARRNTEVLAGAERYYRAMVDAGPESWNIRDHHMADTLDRLMEHHGPGAKAVVWEHNTHIGDARATDMADTGLVNIGRLVRERRMSKGVVLVGFGSYAGTVIAADAWSDVPRTMDVPPARAGSLEDLLHRALDGERALFVFPPVQLQRPPSAGRAEWFHEERGHRAIGVVYRPQFERVGHYVPTVLAQRYDAFCSLDHTRALNPLPPSAAENLEKETWPAGR
ncbi:erythromycin esterase family protein [Streptomyces sp. NPDC001606]